MILKFLKWMLGIFEPAVREPATHRPAPPEPVAQPGSDPVADPVQTSAHDHRAVPGQSNVPGKEFSLGGRVYIIAPLNAAAVKQYRDEIKAVFIGGLPDIELVSKLAYASLRRNYPTITIEAVDDILDYENYFGVWEALMNLSGLVAQAKELTRRVQEQMGAAGLTA